MFTLRDMGTERAAVAVCKGFGAKSALLRHEVAFVLGQMMQKVSIGPLEKVLRNTKEHGMVRHEAAEALGSVAEEAGKPLLEELRTDKEPLVSESCDVALDLYSFWTTHD